MIRRKGTCHPKKDKDQRRHSNKGSRAKEPANPSLPTNSSMISQDKSYLEALVQGSKDGIPKKGDGSKPMMLSKEVSPGASHQSLESRSGISSDKEPVVGYPDEKKAEKGPIGLRNWYLDHHHHQKNFTKLRHAWIPIVLNGIHCWNIHEYDNLHVGLQQFLRTGECHYGKDDCPFPHSPDGWKNKFTRKAKRLQVFKDVNAGKYSYSLPDSQHACNRGNFKDEPQERASRE